MPDTAKRDAVRVDVEQPVQPPADIVEQGEHVRVEVAALRRGHGLEHAWQDGLGPGPSRRRGVVGMRLTAGFYRVRWAGALAWTDASLCRERTARRAVPALQRPYQTSCVNGQTYAWSNTSTPTSAASTRLCQKT